MGKKKGKNKPSSKVKKGNNASPKDSTEITTTATTPSTEDIDRETNPPSNGVVGEDNVDTNDSNATVPVPVSSVDEAPVALIDESSELDVLPSAAETKDAPAGPAEKIDPKSDENISSPSDDEKNVDADDTVGVAASPTEEVVSQTAEGAEIEDANAPSDKKESDEAIAEENPETNNKATNVYNVHDDDDEEPVFLDARSTEMDDLKDDILPVEADVDMNIIESKPELKSETTVEATNDSDNSNSEQAESGGSKEKSIPTEADNKRNSDNGQEANADTKVELIRIYPQNTDDERDLDVPDKVEATDDNKDDNSNSNSSSKQAESDGSKEKRLPTDTESEANADTKVEMIKIYRQYTADYTDDEIIDLNVQDDNGGKDDGIDHGDMDDETYTTYVDDLPLFHYSRIVGSGLPKGIQNKNEETTNNHASLVRHSTCSEFAVVRVDREELVVPSKSNATTGSSTMSDFNALSRTASANSDTLSIASVSSVAVIRKRQREQALLLSSDLWFQPHSIVASGYGGDQGGSISLTRLTDSQSSSGNQNHGSDSSPSVIFAVKTNELIDTSGHGKSSHKSYSSVSTTLQLRDGDSRGSQGTSIVDMSFDASGAVLGAVDVGGHCAIWEFKYTTSLQSTSLVFGDPMSSENTATNGTTANTDTFYTPATTPDPTRPQVSPVSPSRPVPSTSMFSNFMSVLTGIPPSEESAGDGSSHGGTNNDSAHGSISGRFGAVGGNNSHSNNQPSQPHILVPALTAEILNQSRVNYPAKWGPPTCLAVDPAYKLKRDKSVVVGFANGQLYLTKKGTFFQRRNDTILYQAGNRSEDSYRGIETVVWRGPLVAFADATGIKLIDSDHLTRIAHINRPAGASPFLHSSLRDVSPSLVFETAQHLLVGWGDCLMQIYVEEHDDDASSSALSVAQSGGSGETESSSKEKKIKRTAACSMAWELDCVACDVVPLDADHVVVLGLVSLADGEDGTENGDENITWSPSHDLEMQILSRKDGTISYSDSLPLIEEKKVQVDPFSDPIKSLLSVRDFRLFSSFALPRMDEAKETKALRALKGANDMGFVGFDVSFDINQPLFAGTDSFAKKGIEFRDPHLEWNIKSIMYNGNGDDEAEIFGSSNDDDSSVDSDDYECILRPIETIRPMPSKSTDAKAQSILPPTMVVCTESEAILSLTSTVDDAVEYSLDNHKCALALSRGLRHKRQLRRHNLNDLINCYLEALLRIPRFTTEEGDANTAAISTYPELPSSLSLRRMQLAVKAMPVLLGDRTELWERWTKELEGIPGSLFLLRKYLPVRDPILPSTIYVRILEKMLEEVEHLSQTSKRDNPLSIEIHTQASKHFLESLVAWGPTKVLKEYISFYKYNRERRKEEKDLDDGIRSTEISLQRRYLQTAAGYLIFPVRDIEEELKVSAPRYEVHNVDTEDSLFDIAKAVAVIAPRVPIVASPDDFGESGAQEGEASYALAPNNHTCLEAMARLRMMQGEFDSALKCFLAIGALHASDSIESFENSAIQFINGTEATTEISSAPIGDHSYEFVMSLIERHELNQFLFEKDFLVSKLSKDSKLFMPIFALIRLVGLQRVGNFLMDHCVAAGFTYNTSLSEMNAFSFSDEDFMNEPKGILRRGSLPIDKVAEQLENSPAILHWYLHLVFTKRPDFYVNFPTSTTPSKAVTTLHRKHFQLYVDFAGDMRDSSKVLSGIEVYKVESKTTPLLTFLKAALPLGGVLPVDARRVLEIERSKDAEDDDDDNEPSKKGSSSPIFALELAYIVEKYSDETETEAMGILNLYLKGAKSLPLAISYAQRQKKYTSALWDHLISHCLKEASDGMIYGELLEAAALAGADLSRLVERIPPGMVVEGLRPRLVAAVADYRMKLEIYEAAMAAGSEEQVTLMREIGHRVRRGLRYDVGKYRTTSVAELIAEKVRKDKKEASKSITAASINDEEPTARPQILSKTRLRRDHKRLIYSIPRR